MIYGNRKSAKKGRVRCFSPVREPRSVGRGPERAAEHGPGAARLKRFRPGRKRPLQRRSMAVLHKASAARPARTKVVPRHVRP